MTSHGNWLLAPDKNDSGNFSLSTVYSIFFFFEKATKQKKQDLTQKTGLYERYVTVSPFESRAARQGRRNDNEEMELHEKLFESIKKRFDSLQTYLPSISCDKIDLGSYTFLCNHPENGNPLELNIYLCGLAMVQKYQWSDSKG